MPSQQIVEKGFLNDTIAGIIPGAAGRAFQSRENRSRAFPRPHPAKPGQSPPDSAQA